MAHIIVPGTLLTEHIFIPNDMVEAITGKAGVNIDEIWQRSGSVIKINEPQANSNERLVTITGTLEGNQLALYMFRSRLGKKFLSALPRPELMVCREPKIQSQSPGRQRARFRTPKHLSILQCW
jgi:hypothetical protein